MALFDTPSARHDWRRKKRSPVHMNLKQMFTNVGNLLASGLLLFALNFQEYSGA